MPVTDLKQGPAIQFLYQIMSVTGKKIRHITADNAFDSNIFEEFKVNNDVTSTFRPSKSSRSVLVERYHRTLHIKMKSFTPTKSHWSRVLHKAVVSMNCSVNQTTQFCPYYLMFGHMPKEVC